MTKALETVEHFVCEGASLLGIRHLPAKLSSQYGVLIVVGGPQYRVGSHRQFVLLARSLAQSGFETLRFDYRGMGDSAGAVRTFEHVGTDLRVAIDYFYSLRPTLQGVILFGLCDAASAALIYSHSDSRVAGLILTNPWVRTEAGEAAAHVQHYYANRLLQWHFWCRLFSGQVNLLVSIRDFVRNLTKSRSGAPSGSDSASSNFIERMLEGAGRFRRPVLVLLSGNDLTAREFEILCRQQRPWSQWLNAPKCHMIQLPGADHTFSSRAALDASNAEILSWLAATYGAVPAAPAP